ncbi:MAG: choice-of-anchor D domain-containing protein [Candidatus Thiodiazotropha sp. (ex Epidulcina cf. delphinae)]|nr:choice-of-anchor D domain-containing protein [Candidatus Thiodiazotropha sp. (ex Epidulcina cf. delphinae)]
MVHCSKAVQLIRLASKSWRYFSTLMLMLFSANASAVFSVSPGSADFGGIGVGNTSGVITVTFNNDNSTDVIDFSSITASGDFNITNNCPAILDELSSCTIDVRFSPLSAGAAAGTLTIAGHDHSIVLGAGFLPFTTTVSLTGTGQTGDLLFESNGVDLGSIHLGATSNSVPVTLSNAGNATVNITSIATSAPFSQTNNCPTTLNAAGSCTIMVSATPASLGALSGSLTAQGTGPQGATNQSVPLSATAVAGVLNASPTSLSFPDTPVGSTSSPQTITVSNQGNLALQALSVSTTGDFTQTNDCPTTLDPNSSCAISVIASPSASGDITGSVEINSSSGGQTLTNTIPLNVLATAGDLLTSETQLAFTESPVNTSSQPQVVTVTNQGNAPLLINAITTEGDFTQTNDCGTEIAAGGNCDIQVVFAPQTEGSATGALNIDTNSGMTTVPLSGTAAASGGATSTIADLLRPFTNGNPNVISTSEVIAEACPSGRITQRMQEDCNAVVEAATLDDANTTMALFQVTPESATKANNTTRQGGEAQTRNLGSRISALRSGVRGLSFKGLDLQIDEQNLPVELIAQAYNNSGRGGGASADNPLLASRLGVFITGDISTGSKDETDLESGLDFDTYGLTVGADYRITNQFILGGAVGYIDTEAELERNAGDLDAQGYSLSLYGTYYSEQNYFVDFSATYGKNDFDQQRSIIYQLGGLDVNQELTADYDGDMFSLFIGSGYDFNRGAWTFGPRADLEYIKSDVDGFTEETSDPTAPGGGWATRIGETDQRWLTLNVGGRASYTHGTDWGVLIPYARLDWLHEFKDDAQIITAHFVSDPGGNAINIETDDPDRDYLRLRIGTSAQFQNGVVGFIDYGTILAQSDWSVHTISAGLRMEF